MRCGAPFPTLLLVGTALVWVWGCGPHAAAPADRDEPARTHEDFDFYWGELHAHTGLSADGISSDVGEGCFDCGALATVIDDARDIYGLDFLSLTEHGNGLHRVLDLATWDQQLADLVAADDPAGDFVTVPGVEIWTWYADETIRDHRNLLFFGDTGALQDLAYSTVLPPDEDPAITGDDCGELFLWLEGLEQGYGPVLLVPHHPGLAPPAAADWSCSDPRFNPVVENYSQHGNSQTPSALHDWDPVWSNEIPGSMVDSALASDGAGLTLGIIGGTDSHDTRPGSVCDLDPRFDHEGVNYGGGLTGVTLPAGAVFDRPAIGAALQDRRTLSTSGPRIPVDFRMWVEDEAGVLVDTATMGQEADAVSADRLVEFRVRVPVELSLHVVAVDLVFPGVGGQAMVPGGEGEWTLASPWDPSTAERVVVYARLQVDGAAYWTELGVPCDDGGDDDREYLWTSPIWFAAATGDDDDDDDDAGDDDTAGDDDGGTDDDGCECRTAVGPRGVTASVPLVALLIGAGWRLRRRFLP